MKEYIVTMDSKDGSPVETVSRKRGIALFLTIFLSTFLLAFGGIIGSLSIIPAIPHLSLLAQAYKPQLPLSEDRTDDFLALNATPSKQLYPPLSSVANVEVGNWIRIPAIDVAVPIEKSPTLSDADVVATLEAGAALYPNGVDPGHLGNIFIAAHSTGEPWKGKYRFAFLRINELEPGNLIDIDYAGARYTYKVARKEIVKPSNDLRIISDRPVPTMTLMACWPLWSTEKRMLVHAELQNVTKLTPTPGASTSIAQAN